MKANELTLGKRLFYNSGDAIKNAIVTKLEDSGELVNITIDCVIETILGKYKNEQGTFSVEKDKDLCEEIIESHEYPLNGFVSLNFDKLKENAISYTRQAKEDVMRKFDERIANLEKIQLEDL